MAIYIGVIKAGKNAGKPVASFKFKNKYEFYLYCNEINMMRDTQVKRSMNIDDLCDTICDVGFGGIGSRYYKRISYKEGRRIQDNY